MPSPVSWLRLVVIDKAEVLELIHRPDNLPVSVKPRPVAPRPLVVGFRARVGCRPPLPCSFRVKSQSNGSRVLQACGRPKDGGDAWPDDFGLPPKAKWDLISEVFEDRSPWMEKPRHPDAVHRSSKQPICGPKVIRLGHFGCLAPGQYTISVYSKMSDLCRRFFQSANSATRVPHALGVIRASGQFCQGRLYSRSSRATACSNVSPSPQPC